jgi:hypothetical protein
MTGQAEAFVPFIIEYAAVLPSEALAGNVFAVSILLIAFYILVFIINQLTGLIIFILKKLILLAIVSLAFSSFMVEFLARVGADGLTQDNITFGVIGFLAGFAAMMIAIYAAIASFKTLGGGVEEDERPRSQETVAAAHGETSKPKEIGYGFRQLLSMDTLKNDRSLGAVLAYLVVAEFGVFSSKTISAPNVSIGLLFFTAFMAAAFFFIRQSYRDFRRGLHHLTVAFIVGGALSILLGNLWGGLSLGVLLSPAYFTSDSMVALVTGIALSLFMGSKN